MDFKKLIHCAIVFAAVPVIAYADQNYYTSFRGGERGGEREGGDFNREEGGQQNRTQGQEEQFHNQQGNSYYNKSNNENLNRNYNPVGHPGAYERGYQQGSSTSSGSGAAYYPTPMYSEPTQQPYNTEPPVQQNQPYQYQYQYPN